MLWGEDLWKKTSVDGLERDLDLPRILLNIHHIPFPVFCLLIEKSTYKSRNLKTYVYMYFCYPPGQIKKPLVPVNS